MTQSAENVAPHGHMDKMPYQINLRSIVRMDQEPMHLLQAF